MDWVSLAIPLIAVAVWIFSHLAGQQKEAYLPPRMPPRPRNPLDTMAPGSQTKPEEDNKYREEMDRKREKKTVPPASRQLPQPRPRPRRPLAGPKYPQSPAIPVPSELSRTSEKDRDQRGQVPMAILLETAPLLVEPAIKIGQAAVPIEKPTPAAVKKLLELLKNKESLTTALLLKEVLDLPLAKRPRRRL